MTSQRSAQWYAGSDRNAYIHRAWMRRGLPAHAFDGRPHIAIANTASDLTPCNAHLNEVAESVKQGVWEAGGVPLNLPVVSLGVFALGAALAALGGVIGGGFLGVYPGADFEVLPYAFVVVIVGGLGSLPGAMVGSLLVGLLDNFGKALFPELSYFTLFAPMALILALRPTGLFGRA